MHVSISMRIAALIEPITDAGWHHIRSHVCVLVCAPARACVFGRTRMRRKAQARSVGVDCVRLGSQAFSSASAFNANIGAWNTASVTSLISVCAAFCRQRATRRAFSAGPRCRCAWRHRRCVCVCVCAHTYRHSLARVSTCLCIAAHRKAGMYVCVCM